MIHWQNNPLLRIIFYHFSNFSNKITCWPENRMDYLYLIFQLILKYYNSSCGLNRKYFNDLITLISQQIVLTKMAAFWKFKFGKIFSKKKIVFFLAVGNAKNKCFKAKNVCFNTKNVCFKAKNVCFKAKNVHFKAKNWHFIKKLVF